MERLDIVMAQSGSQDEVGGSQQEEVFRPMFLGGAPSTAPTAADRDDGESHRVDEMCHINTALPAAPHPPMHAMGSWI